MSHTPENHYLWRISAFMLWLLFFAVGFVPEYVFLIVREWGHVASQRAFINSEFMLSFGLCAYLTYFTYSRCVEAACAPQKARAITFQVMVFSLLAFFPLVALAVQWEEIPVTSLRNLVLWIMFLKWLAWIYLYIMVIRYYFFDGQQVFHNLLLVFPSARSFEDSAKVENKNTDKMDNTDMPNQEK